MNKDVNKKIQLRRCASCQKVGHNKSTCQEPVSPAISPSAKAPAAPLKFFVHHVDHTATPSTHVLDLKRGTQGIWDTIQSSSPILPPTLYHSYHQIAEEPPSQLTPPTKPSPKATPLFATLKPAQSKTSKPDKVKPNEAPRLPIFRSLLNELSQIKKDVFKVFRKKPRHTFVAVAKPVPRWTSDRQAPEYLAQFKKIPHKLGLLWQSWRSKISPRRLVLSVFFLAIIAAAPSSAKSYYYSLKTTKAAVAENSAAGFAALEDSTVALKQADLASAEKSSLVAIQKFNTATTALEAHHRLLQTLAAAMPFLGSEFVSRQKILLAGQEIATGNSYILDGLKESQADTKKTLTKRLAVILERLAAALPNYTKALENLKAVDSAALPLKYQTQFNNFRELFANLLNDFGNLSDVGSSLQEIFGGQGLRRYLLVFQNEHELRPTGGFMGSLAILDIKDGEIIKLEVPPGGSYDFQGQLNKFVEPPSPLLLADKRWEFQDANWFPDFPASAQKILWFYQHSRGVTADGVIAINGSVLARLLEIVGPITDEKRQITLTADNALPTIQQVVEEGPEKNLRKPKQIIADLAPRFVDFFKTLRSENIMPLLVNLKEALEQKEIQAYFTDTQTENTIKAFGWGGQLLPTKLAQDYILVINTNIQGQKSDAKIKQAISHQALVQADGSIVDTVTITREHAGKQNEKLYGQTNINYLRVYVPVGSELISARGFSWPDEKSFRAPDKWYKKDAYLASVEREIKIDSQSGTKITSEFGKTAFGNWVITEPGQTSQVQFSYRLPFKLESGAATYRSGWKKIITALGEQLVDYQLIAQKQSGVTSAFESQVIFPDTWSPIWKDGQAITLAKNGASIDQFRLDKDTVWSVLVKKNN